MKRRSSRITKITVPYASHSQGELSLRPPLSAASLQHCIVKAGLPVEKTPLAVFQTSLPSPPTIRKEGHSERIQEQESRASNPVPARSEHEHNKMT